jgi:hypothetical protein
VIARYGLPLYPSLKDAAAREFERCDDNADGILVRKRVAKGWEYAFVLHPHLRETYR